ncbi:Eukaryotic translation initiation factor 4B [Recurvomyces mirabilis]|nr:Eukaryotic translation initiation factor 4B [Recurvomyces mirabilis]
MAPKKKQEKMNLGEFLTNQSLGSWADEMDAQPMPSAASGYSGNRDRGDRDRDGGEKRSFTQPAWESARGGASAGGGMGMGGGMGDRGASYGNLTYDVSQADVEGFLSDCEVTSVRLVEDKFDRKPKGFGYVEFGSLEGLKTALTKSESSFMGRNVKISVAEPPKDRPESSRDFSDWSRKGPLPELPQNTRQPSGRGFGRSFDERSDAGSERGGSRRPAFFEGDSKPRDLGNWERKGPLSPVPGAGPPVRDGGRLREGPPPGERRRSPAWGEGRSDAGSRPPRKEFEAARPVVERAPTAAEQDNQWRSRMQPDQPATPAAEEPKPSAPTSPVPQAPKERPRLNLAKRTVSTAEPAEGGVSSASDSKASPFGAARPIDTAAKERELEEKREIAIRQKSEADAKAKEEKTAQDAATRAARAERADKGQAQEEVSSPTGNAPQRNNDRGPRRPSRQQSQQNGARGSQPKENGDAPPQKERPNFSILSHEGEGGEDDSAAQEEHEGELDAPDGVANGIITGDKETKPQEITREVPKNGAAQGDDTTAEAMEDDGWSTVAAKPKKSGRGGQRAMAS